MKDVTIQVASCVTVRGEFLGWEVLDGKRTGRALARSFGRIFVGKPLADPVERRAPCEFVAGHTVNWCQTCGRDELDMPNCPLQALGKSEALT
jgi:hypothetical protein